MYQSFRILDCSIRYTRQLFVGFQHTVCAIRSNKASPAEPALAQVYRTSIIGLLLYRHPKPYFVSFIEEDLSRENKPTTKLHCKGWSAKMCHLYIIYFQRCGHQARADSLCKKAKDRKDHVPCFDKEIKQIARDCCCSSDKCDSPWGCKSQIHLRRIRVNNWRNQKPGLQTPHTEQQKVEQELTKLEERHSNCLSERIAVLPSPDD
jgi:hypothetical protein